jgi:hypothetical protein
MIDGNLVDLISTKKDSVSSFGLVLQNLDFAQASFFPLFSVRVEPDKMLKINVRFALVARVGWPCGLSSYFIM